MLGKYTYICLHGLIIFLLTLALPTLLWCGITDSCCCFPGSVDTACISRTLGTARMEGLSPHPAHVGFRRHPGSGCIPSIFPAASYPLVAFTAGHWGNHVSPMPFSFRSGGGGWFTSLLISGLPHYCLFGFSALLTP